MTTAARARYKGYRFPADIIGQIAQREASAERFYGIFSGEDEGRFLAQLRSVEPSNAETLSPPRSIASAACGHRMTGSDAARICCARGWRRPSSSDRRDGLRQLCAATRSVLCCRRLRPRWLVPGLAYGRAARRRPCYRGIASPAERRPGGRSMPVEGVQNGCGAVRSGLSPSVGQGSNLASSCSQSVSAVNREAIGEKPRTWAAVCGWLPIRRGNRPSCRRRSRMVLPSHSHLGWRQKSCCFREHIGAGWRSSVGLSEPLPENGAKPGLNGTASPWGTAASPEGRW